MHLAHRAGDDSRSIGLLHNNEFPKLVEGCTTDKRFCVDFAEVHASRNGSILFLSETEQVFPPEQPGLQAQGRENSGK